MFFKSFFSSCQVIFIFLIKQSLPRSFFYFLISIVSAKRRYAFILLSFHEKQFTHNIQKDLRRHTPAPISFHLPSNHADGSDFSWFFLYRVHLLPQHIPVLLYHTSDYKEAAHFPVYTIPTRISAAVHRIILFSAFETFPQKLHLFFIQDQGIYHSILDLLFLLFITVFSPVLRAVLPCLTFHFYILVFYINTLSSFICKREKQQHALAHCCFSLTHLAVRW